MRTTEAIRRAIRGQARFRGLIEGEAYTGGVLARRLPVMGTAIYPESRAYVEQALDAGLDGTQRERLEEELAARLGMKYAVATSSGAYALACALRLAAERLYGRSGLRGRRVFCSALADAELVHPIVSLGGDPVFIDADDSGYGWAMSAEVLAMAMEAYPEPGIVVMHHIYGYPGDIRGIREVCEKYGALLIECAGEAFGASYQLGTGDSAATQPAGTAGDYCVLDFGKERLLGGAPGGALVTRDGYAAEKAAYWAEGASASTPWRQHEEIGYQCRMGDTDAAILRGGLAHLEELIDRKRAISRRYRENLMDPQLALIPVGEGTEPAYLVNAILLDDEARFLEARNDRRYVYRDLTGAATPMEICEVLDAFGAESRPLYKPMPMQPIYREREYFTADGAWHRYEGLRDDSYYLRCDRAREYYERGLVLPSDVGMTEAEQDAVVDLVLACFERGRE